MMVQSLIAFLALFTGVFAMEKTLVLNRAGITYDVHNLVLDRARTDVRIVEDELEYRCGGLTADTSVAPRYSVYVRYSLLPFASVATIILSLSVRFIIKMANAYDQSTTRENAHYFLAIPKLMLPFTSLLYDLCQL